MLILGILFVISGVGSSIFGLIQNNDGEARLASFFESGNLYPGMNWIIGGIIAILIGAILIFVGMKKKNS